MSRHAQFTANGAPFFSLGGQTHNSSGYVLSELDRAFLSVKKLGGNTIAIPVCWDAFEPREGDYDENYVKSLIRRTREEGLRLVLLWFGTWKNGTMEYCPAWVKRDRERFPRVLCADRTVTSVLSSHSEENRNADCRAFCALMRLLRDFDSAEQTVIAVQVENEAGILGGTRRDFSPLGEAAFQSPVPPKLIEYALTHPLSRLAAYHRQAGYRPSGTWREVFGTYGAEAVSAWSIARYIDHIAGEGKKIYDLFLYANVWLDGGKDGSGWDLGGVDYPCGGAVSKSLDIWCCACRNLDAIAPDNYQTAQERHREVADTYALPEEGFPLYVPESAPAALNAALMFYAVAEKEAIGYHIFGTESALDETGELTEGGAVMARSMRMLAAISPLLTKYRGTGHVHSVVQLTGEAEGHLRLEGWKCLVSYSGLGYGWNAMDYRHHRAILEEGAGTMDYTAEKGRGLLIQVSRNEFYLVGHMLRLVFRKPEPEDGHIPALLLSNKLYANNSGYLELTEGHFNADGNYVADRVRSGDEARHGIWAQADCGVIHCILEES